MKTTGLIKASADGQKEHMELQLIMQTLMANFTSKTALLIQGIKGKINQEGKITNLKTAEYLRKFAEVFNACVRGDSHS